MEMDFERQYRAWGSCDTEDLFILPVSKSVSDVSVWAKHCENEVGMHGCHTRATQLQSIREARPPLPATGLASSLTNQVGALPACLPACRTRRT